MGYNNMEVLIFEFQFIILHGALRVHVNTVHHIMAPEYAREDAVLADY